MTLREVADVVGGVAHGEATVTGGAFLDLRAAEHGGFLVALEGEHVDGHDVARAAGTAGAVAVLGSRPTALPTVVVDDVTEALGRLARHVLDRLPDAVVLAMTGHGTTGPLDHLAHALSANGPTIATPGGLHDELGVSLTVLRATPETRYLVLAMAARGVGQLARLCSIAPPHVAAVLDVGTARVGELLEALGPGDVAVLDADDDLARAVAARTRATVTTFGGPGADVAVHEVTTDEIGRQSFELAHRGSFATVHLAQVGSSRWRDAVPAAAMALAAGLDLDAVADALSDAVPASRRRMEPGERADGLVVLDDAHDADPESVRAALDTLAGIGARSGRRTVAVLGEVLEPGDGAAEAHRALGAYAAEVGVDLLVTVGPAAGAVAEGHSGAGARGVTIPTAGRDAAVEWLRHNVSAADVVLVTASRGAALDVIADELLEEGNSNR
ncbi:MAG: glutamate ligase domain-containing protein [Terrabacter sp.]